MEATMPLPATDAPRRDDTLEQRARIAYPEHELCHDNSRNRREWLRAVRALRAGRGWVLDGAVVNWQWGA